MPYDSMIHNIERTLARVDVFSLDGTLVPENFDKYQRRNAHKHAKEDSKAFRNAIFKIINETRVRMPSRLLLRHSA